MSLLLLFSSAATGVRTLTLSSSPAIAGTGIPVTVTALLVDADGNPLVGKTIYFEVGAESGTDVTDVNGEATFVFIPTTGGSYTVLARWGAGDGIDIISSDKNLDLIYRHDGFSTTILDSFAAPAVNPEGIGWDGDNLLICTDSTVYRMVGFSSTVDTSVAAPAGAGVLRGVAWDGTNLLVADHDDIYRCDGFSNSVLSTVARPGSDIEITGIGWDGDNLITVTNNGVTQGHIYRHDGFSSSLLATIATPSILPRSATWDGENLYSVDDFGAGGRLYQHNGFSAATTADILSPNNEPTGIEWLIGAAESLVVSVATYGRGHLGRRTARLVP